ncbi:hypothetical protein [Paenibacillus macquariensis]|uniref:Uncharacterized protein n=1 Tax=Paenibacillus macquariensis TaxID=948756 RepID=A0ABY1JS16_9BACL|nr:hypothetical protein [Paenibacillus macquariensis]MEC0092864.1 hypothetical protein [Paenibacillus macquariensis]OAB36242.1 hypothetical protein PMSM_07270 [Paenibacillus macquariensis subsp. macquariensis]SIQ67773.1 hypothetical protein SAMN05421578_103319 [Paenibacillus macquariensis]
MDKQLKEEKARKIIQMYTDANRYQMQTIELAKLKRELKEAQERESEFQGMVESIAAYASGVPKMEYQEIEDIINSAWLIIYGVPGMKECEPK